MAGLTVDQLAGPFGKSAIALAGLVNTNAVYGHAPDVVERVRRLRAERFAFERRQGRWKRHSNFAL